MVNTITLAMKFYKQPQYYDSILDMLNLFFTAVFALEFVFKLAAFRFKVRLHSINTYLFKNTGYFRVYMFMHSDKFLKYLILNIVNSTFIFLKKMPTFFMLSPTFIEYIIMSFILIPYCITIFSISLEKIKTKYVPIQ